MISDFEFEISNSEISHLLAAAAPRRSHAAG